MNSCNEAQGYACFQYLNGPSHHCEASHECAITKDIISFSFSARHCLNAISYTVYKRPKTKKNQLSAVVSAILNLHVVQFKAWKHYRNADMTGLSLLLEIVSLLLEIVFQIKTIVG